MSTAAKGAPKEHFNTLSVRKLHGLGTNNTIDCGNSSFMNALLIGKSRAHINFNQDNVEVTGPFRVADSSRRHYNINEPTQIPSNKDTREIISSELGGKEAVFTDEYHTKSPRLLVRIGNVYSLTRSTTLDELYHYIQDTIDSKHRDRKTGALLLRPGEAFDGGRYWIHASSDNNQLSASASNASKTYDGIIKPTTEQIQAGSDEAVTHIPMVRNVRVFLGKSSDPAKTKMPDYGNGAGVIVSSRSPWVRCESCDVRGHLTTEKPSSSHSIGGFVGAYLGKKGFASMFLGCTVSGSSDIQGSGGFVGANMISRTDSKRTTPALFSDCRVRMSLTKTAKGAGGFVGSEAFETNATVRFVSCQVGQRAVAHEPLLGLDDVQSHVVLQGDRCGGLVGDYMSTTQELKDGSTIEIDQCSIDGLTIQRDGDGAGGLIGGHAGVFSTITITQSEIRDMFLQADNAGGILGKDWNYSDETQTTHSDSTLTIQNTYAFLAEQSGTDNGSLLGNAQHTTQGTLSLTRVTYSVKATPQLDTTNLTYTATDIDSITKNHTSEMVNSVRDAALSGRLYANLREGDPGTPGEVYVDHLMDGTLKVSGSFEDEAGPEGSSTIIATQSSTSAEKQKANVVVDGTNDTEAIQQALDRMLTDLPEAGILYLASGTFLIDSSQTGHSNDKVAIQIPQGVSIQGSHIGTTTLKVMDGKSSAQTVIQHGDHARLRDLTIDMNATTRSVSGLSNERAVLFQGSKYADMTGIHITNSAGHGIELTDDPVNPRIENVSIEKSDLQAIRITSHSHTHNVDSQCRIQWCRIEDSGAENGSDGDGAVHVSGKHVYLDDVTIRCANKESGIVFVSGSQDNHCRRLLVHNTTTHGVVCESNVKRTRIEGCQLIADSGLSNSSDRVGIRLGGGSYNRITGAYLEAFATACDIQDGSHHVIHDLRVRDGHRAVHLHSGTQQTSLSDVHAQSMTGEVIVAHGTQHTLSEIHASEIGYTNGEQSDPPSQAPIPFDIQATHSGLQHFSLRNSTRSLQFSDDQEETMVRVHGDARHTHLSHFVLDAGPNQGIKHGVVCDAVHEITVSHGRVTECSGTFLWIKGNSDLCRVENVRFQHTNASNETSLDFASSTQSCRIAECYFEGTLQLHGERHALYQNRFVQVPTTAITVNGDKCYLNGATLHDIGDGQTDKPVVLILANDVYLMNVEITAQTQSTKHCGIQTKGERTVIDGCTIDANCDNSLDSSDVLKRGICVETSDTEAQCRIHSAFIYRCQQAGAYIDSNHVYVIGSSFQDNAEYGLYFTKNAGHTVVSESSARNNGTDPFWKHADAVVIWGTNFGNNLPNELLRLTTGDTLRRQAVQDGPLNIDGYPNWFSVNSNGDGVTTDIRNNNLADHLMHYLTFNAFSDNNQTKVQDQVDSSTTVTVPQLDSSAHKTGHKSLHLNTNDTVSLPSSFLKHTTQDFTVSFWVFIESNTESKQTIVQESASGSASGTYTILYTTNQEFSVELEDTSGNSTTLTSSSGPYSASQWQLLQVIREGDMVTLFVNNQQEAQTTLNSADANIADHSDGQIGSGTFAGNIDAFAVWSRPLTTDDIAALWNENNGIDVTDVSFQRKVHLSFGSGFERGTKIDVGVELQPSKSLQWDAESLTQNATNYLYITYDEDTETIAEGATTITPLYQRARPPIQTIADDTFWYPIDHRHRGEVYDATSRQWNRVLRLYVGQVSVDGNGHVSDVTTYAYQGYYLSPLQDAQGEGTTVFQHNIGTQRVASYLFARFKSTSSKTLGYDLQDEISLAATQNASHLTYTDPNGLDTVFSTSETTFGNIPHATGDDVTHAPPWSDFHLFAEIVRSF